MTTAAMPPTVTLIMFFRINGDNAGAMNTVRVYSELMTRFFVGSGMEIVTFPLSVVSESVMSAIKNDLYLSTAVSTTEFGSVPNMRYAAVKANLVATVAI